MTVSIVLYKTSFEEVQLVVKELRKNSVVTSIYLIDNSEGKNNDFESLEATYIYNNRNIGYGAGHNIAIKDAIERGEKYHLVLNSDILLDSQILNNLAEYLDTNSDTALISPKIYYPNGQLQYSCKMLPSPFRLIARRFFPDSWFEKSDARFELREKYNEILNAPYISGCFMLFRLSALQEIGFFDERFFMYPEDIDITRRLHKKYKTIMYPDLSIIHNHNRGSYKNYKLLLIHITNMIKYFNKWGWFFDKERKRFNEMLES